MSRGAPREVAERLDALCRRFSEIGYSNSATLPPIIHVDRSHSDQSHAAKALCSTGKVSAPPQTRRITGITGATKQNLSARAGRTPWERADTELLRPQICDRSEEPRQRPGGRILLSVGSMDQFRPDVANVLRSLRDVTVYAPRLG